MKIEPIAHIECAFKTKFGLPRQGSGISEIKGRIVFEEKYRDINALRGLDGFSHIYIIWGFDVPEKGGFQATVRPPRLGGNTRMGVFATRSPFRPNPIGLTIAKIISINPDCTIDVSGIDMMDGTKIYDIKPYLPHADIILGAKGGFASEVNSYEIKVDFPDDLLKKIPEAERTEVINALRQDPRPSYQRETDRKYGFAYGNFDIRFTVESETLTVRDVIAENATIAKDNK